MKDYDSTLLFDKIPQAINQAAFQMFSVDGVAKEEKQNKPSGS